MPFIIVSAKKNIRAISGTNNDVEFHNKLFNTDDCVITWQADPTPEEIEAQKAQVEIDQASAKVVADAEAEKEKLIQEKMRELAIIELKAEGKLDINEKIVMQIENK